MPSRLEVDNFKSINIKQKSLLNVSAIATATSITPQNTDGFDADDIIFLGNYGADQVEKLEISSVSSGNLIVPALSFNHDRFEPITDVYGDQIQFYSAPDPGTGYAPTDDTFSTLGSPVSIDPTTLATEYVDSGGGSAYWYKYVYWNSIDNIAVTYLSDVDAVQGGNIGFYIDVDSVRGAAGFKTNENITDAYIASFILKANDYINGKLFGIYSLPFLDPIPDTIKNIARLYAAGLMLLDQYGVFGTGSEVDGKQKMQDADDILQEITSFTLEIRDQSGKSLRIFTPVAGWPDASTASTPGFDDNGDPQFGGQGMDSSPIMPITKVY
jgi:hypothetical protein